MISKCFIEFDKLLFKIVEVEKTYIHTYIHTYMPRVNCGLFNGFRALNTITGRADIYLFGGLAVVMFV